MGIEMAGRSPATGLLDKVNERDAAISRRVEEGGSVGCNPGLADCKNDDEEPSGLGRGRDQVPEVAEMIVDESERAETRNQVRTGCGRAGEAEIAVVPGRLERQRRTLLANSMLMSDLDRDLAADHLGRMRGSRRLRCGAFVQLGLSTGSKLSDRGRLKALGLSEMLLRAREHERGRTIDSMRMCYWWLARARIWNALKKL